MIAYVGINEPGLYRESASAVQLNSLKARFDQGKL